MKKVYKTNLINDLTTFKGMPNASVIVLGGTIIGDGNGGTYYWDDASTATADGINIIEVTGVVNGRWIKLAGGVNPDQFIQNQNSVYQTANYKIDGTGENGFLITSGTVVPPPNFSEVGRAIQFNNTLTATNHVQTLIGLDINPTYSLGAFSASALCIPLRISTSGDSIFGELIRLQHTTPRVTFYNATGSTSFAYITADVTNGLTLASSGGLGIHVKLGDISPPIISMNPSTRSIIIQPAVANYNEGFYLLDVQGTSRHAGGVVGSGSQGRAHLFNPTLVTGGNNQTMVAVDITSTLSSAHTGAIRYDLRTTNSVNLATSNGSFVYINGGAEALKVGTNTGNPDHAFIGFYARTVTPTVRSGYLGYQNAASTELQLANELSGSIGLTTGGATSDVIARGISFRVTPNVASVQNWQIVGGYNSSEIGNRLTLESSLTTITAGNTIRGAAYRGVTSARTPVLNNDVFVQLSGQGYFNASNATTGASITISATEDWSITNRGARISFSTIQNGFTTLQERFRIDHDGKILSSYKSSSTAPTTTDIPNGYSAAWHNTTTGEARLYMNIGGTLKSVLLT